MSEWPNDTADLSAALRDYLVWQKRLGHPGLPVELLAARSRPAPASPSSKPPLEPSRRSAEAMPAKASKSSGKTAAAPVAAAFPIETTSATGERLTLEDLRTELGDCQRCKLHETRHSIVFGEGDPHADILFIGEGPGADEDASGRPFVGRAGKLLDKWIELGMGIPREKVYIGNIVKCRPPKNRDPEKDEVAACIGFIRAQIRAINPKVIVLLGRVPMLHMLGERTGITKVHGTFYELEGIPAVPIFHPSYCLRPPLDEKRRLVWEDLKKILTHLGMPIPGKKK